MPTAGTAPVGEVRVTISATSSGPMIQTDSWATASRA